MIRATLLALGFVWAINANADNLKSQLILDTGQFTAQTDRTDIEWVNPYALTVRIHSIELHMICPPETWIGCAAWISRASDGSQVIRGGLYYSTTSPYLMEKTFSPNYMDILPGDGLILRYSSSPAAANPYIYHYYAIVWFTFVAPGTP